MSISSAPTQSFRWLLAGLLTIILGLSIAFQVDQFQANLAKKHSDNATLKSLLSDLSVTRGQAKEYYRFVTSHTDAAIHIRRELFYGEPRSGDTLRHNLDVLQYDYRWGMTDLTWASMNPRDITDEELRDQLILIPRGLFARLPNPLQQPCSRQ